MRTTAITLALFAALTPSRASAQICPRAPASFRPHVAAEVPDTLRARADVELTVSLRHVHCTTSRARPPRILPSELRVTVVDGPFAGRVLPLRARRDQFVFTMPGPGAYSLRVESVLFPQLAAAVVSLRLMDARRARSVSFALGRSPFDEVGAGSPDTRLVIYNEQTSLTLYGARYARGRTTPALSLEPGTYTLQSLDRSSRMTRFTVDEGRGRAVIPVQFFGSPVSISTDLQPDSSRVYSLLVRTGTATQTWMLLRYPETVIDEDLPEGPITLTLRSIEARSYRPNDPSLAWTELHRETLQITRQTRQNIHWSLSAILAGQGSAPRPWHTLGSFAGAGDSLILLTDRLAQRTERGWTALSMPTGWPQATAIASLTSVSPTAVAWVEESSSVSYRTATGISRETLPLSRINALSCSARGIAALGADELIAVGACVEPRHHDAESVRVGFVAIRDRARWTVLNEASSPLLSVAAVGDHAIAVGEHGTITTYRQGALTTRSIGDQTLSRVRAGRTRVVITTMSEGIFEYVEQSGERRPIVEPTPSQFGGITYSESCFIDDTLVLLLKRTPDITRARVYVDGGNGLVSVRTQSANILGLACTRTEAWTLDVTADGAHSLTRLQLPQAR